MVFTIEGYNSNSIRYKGFYCIILFGLAAKSADEKDPGAYMYDERGLKVRRDSLRSETEQQAETKKPPTESK